MELIHLDSKAGRLPADALEKMLLSDSKNTDVKSVASSSSTTLSSVFSTLSLTRANHPITKPSRDDLNRLMKDSVFVDFFNVYLNLPIFPQRVIYDTYEMKFHFDPPVAFGTMNNEIPPHFLSSLGSWIIEKRYCLFLHSLIYWEYCLCVDLISPEPFDNGQKFTALSCNKFVHEHVGNVIGMKMFRKHLKKTAGYKIYLILKDIDRYYKVDKMTGVDKLEHMNEYQELRHKILMRTHDQITTTLLYKDEINDDLDINDSTIEQLKEILFFTLKVYWLPRYLLHCSSKRSQRRIYLEKEVNICMKFVGKYLLEFPMLKKFQIITYCIESVSPTTSATSIKSKILPQITISPESSVRSSQVPKSKKPTGDNQSREANNSRKERKKTEITPNFRAPTPKCMKEKHAIINYLFPAYTKDKGNLKQCPYHDVCICVDPLEAYTCNEKDAKIAGEHQVHLPPEGTIISPDEKTLQRSPVTWEMTSKPALKTESMNIEKQEPNTRLSSDAKSLFKDIDGFYNKHPHIRQTLTVGKDNKTNPFKSHPSERLKGDSPFSMSLSQASTKSSTTEINEIEDLLMSKIPNQFFSESAIRGKRYRGRETRSFSSGAMGGWRRSSFLQQWANALIKWRSAELTSEKKEKRTKIGLKRARRHRRSVKMLKSIRDTVGGRLTKLLKGYDIVPEKLLKQLEALYEVQRNSSSSTIRRSSKQIYQTRQSVLKSLQYSSSSRRQSRERSQALFRLSTSMTGIQSNYHKTSILRRTSQEIRQARSTRQSIGSTVFDQTSTKLAEKEKVKESELAGRKWTPGGRPAEEEEAAKPEEVETNILQTTPENLTKNQGEKRKKRRKKRSSSKLSANNLEVGGSSDEIPIKPKGKNPVRDNLKLSTLTIHTKEEELVTTSRPKTPTNAFITSVKQEEKRAMYESINIIFTIQRGARKWYKAIENLKKTREKPYSHTTSAYQSQPSVMRLLSGLPKKQSSHALPPRRIGSSTSFHIADKRQSTLKSVKYEEKNQSQGYDDDGLSHSDYKLKPQPSQHHLNRQGGSPVSGTEINDNIPAESRHAQITLIQQLHEITPIMLDQPRGESQHSSKQPADSFARFSMKRHVTSSGKFQPLAKFMKSSSESRPKLTVSASKLNQPAHRFAIEEEKNPSTSKKPSFLMSDRARTSAGSLFADGSGKQFVTAVRERIILEEYTKLWKAGGSKQTDDSREDKSTKGSMVSRAINATESEMERDGETQTLLGPPNKSDQKARSMTLKRPRNQKNILPSLPHTEGEENQAGWESGGKTSRWKSIRQKLLKRKIRPEFDLNPKDSLIDDIISDKQAKESKLVGYAERFKTARRDVWLPFPPVPRLREWRSPTAEEKRHRGTYDPRPNNKEIAERSSTDYVDYVMKAYSLLTSDIKGSGDLGVRPPILPGLVKSIDETTIDKQRNYMIMREIPGVPHITKHIYPLGANISTWNYIIQRYDTCSPAAYRTQHSIYLLCMNSDRYAGKPFLQYLKSRSLTAAVSNYMFWFDSEEIISELSKGNASEQVRMRRSKKLIRQYLLVNSPHYVSLQPELRDLLVFALQLDECKDILQYCQDVTIERCRSYWKSFLKFEKTAFNQFLKLENVRTRISAVRSKQLSFQIDQFNVKINSQSILPSIKPTAKNEINNVCEQFNVELSADQDVIKMNGDQAAVNSYLPGFNENKMNSHGIVHDNKEQIGLISLDSKNMNIAYSLLNPDDDEATDSYWNYVKAGSDKKSQKKAKKFGSYSFNKADPTSQLPRNVLPAHLRKKLGLDKPKPLTQLKIARFDIEPDDDTHTIITHIQKKRVLRDSPVSHQDLMNMDFFNKKSSQGSTSSKSDVNKKNSTQDKDYVIINKDSENLLTNAYTSPRIGLKFITNIKLGSKGKRSKRTFSIKAAGSSESETDSDDSDDYDQSSRLHKGKKKKKRSHSSTKKLKKDKKRRRSRGSKSKHKNVFWMDPINKDGVWYERPKYKPVSMLQVLTEEIYRMFFIKFLEHTGGSTKLVELWTNLDEVLKDRKERKYKLELIAQKYFRKPSDFKSIDDPIFKEIMKFGKISMSQIENVKKILHDRLDKDWFEEFRDTFPDAEDSEKAAQYNIKVNQSVGKWKRITFIFCGFFKGLKNKNLRNRFLVYLKKETSADTVSPSSAIAPQVTPVKVNLAGATSKVSLTTSTGSGGAKDRKTQLQDHKDKSKLCNDALFILEAQRYFRIVRNVKSNEQKELPPRDDYIYAKCKARAIVDRFFDSESQPKNQLNIPPALADITVKNTKYVQADAKLFYEAEQFVIYNIVSHWRKFLMSYWVDCNEVQLIEPPVTPIDLPLFDTVHYEYILVNTFGEAEMTRVICTIVNGIRQYIFVPRTIVNTSRETKNHSLAGGYLSSPPQPSVAVHRYSLAS